MMKHEQPPVRRSGRAAVLYTEKQKRNGGEMFSKYKKRLQILRVSVILSLL